MTARPTRHQASVIAASETIATTCADAYAAVLSPAGLRTWFRGVSTVDIDDAWPKPPGRMTWTVRIAGQFVATVIEHDPPRRIVLDVRTPSARSRITHTFDSLPDGKTRYTKTVEPSYRQPARPWRPALNALLRTEVRREVHRAARHADGAPMARPAVTMLALAGLSWLGFATHNLADLPDQTLLSPETALPTLVYAVLIAGWFTRLRQIAQWLLLGWTALHAVGGGVISVLPLPVLPFEPEQSLYHYSFHVLYTATQLPLLIVLLRDIRRRPRHPTTSDVNLGPKIRRARRGR
jgi:uncharacterized protein YndB with AHSA1/START domain